MAFVVYDSSSTGLGGAAMGLGSGWRPAYTPKATGGVMSCALASQKDSAMLSTPPPQSALQQPRHYSRYSTCTCQTNPAAFAFLASRPPAAATASSTTTTTTTTTTSTKKARRPAPPVSPSSQATSRVLRSSRVSPSYQPQKAAMAQVHEYYSAVPAAASAPIYPGLLQPSQRRQAPTGFTTGLTTGLTTGPNTAPPLSSGLDYTPQLRNPLAPPPIDALPAELLDAVLDTFPTPALLPLASVSRRFYLVVSRLLYRRLRRAVALANYQLTLACYHPSAKISTPYLRCAYLGTDGLDDPDDASLLRGLPSMYSRFRPVPPSDADVHVRNYRAIRRTMNFFMLSDTASGGTAATALQTVAGGGVEGEAAAGAAAAGAAASAAQADSAAPKVPPLVAYDVHLDEGELFSQLCTVANLVKTSARPGLFLNSVNVNDGVIRVWRDWLGKRAAETATATAATATKNDNDDPDDKNVLWAYMGKHMGMRFRVTEQPSPAAAVENNNNNNNHNNHNNARRATAPVEEPPVSFQLEYEELYVRTYELLLSMEAAEMQDASGFGRAVIVSSL